MPLFSVIIPTYNRAELLARALESVYAQTFTDYEVIVVDDGSTDGTEDLVKTLGNRMRLLQQPNLGPGAGRNLGANHAQGDYLAFLDSDDLWFPWTLGSFANLIAHHQSPAILSGRLMEFSDEAELQCLRSKEPTAEVFDDYFAAHHKPYFVGAGMAVIKRDAFRSSGGFTIRRINAEDHDLIMRMGTASGFVQIVEPTTLGWRRHSGSATTDIRRSFEGGWYLIEQERAGAFPGGAARARQRMQILTRHTRPFSLECLRAGLRAEAWALYRATFSWHLALGRFKFLAGFPLQALRTKLRP